jgi:hypothetical protein
VPVRAIVFNDTSRFHHGCAAVMRQLHAELAGAGIEVVESVYGNTWKLSKSLPIWREESMAAAELIVINGEGTMHDDGRLAVFYLEEVVARREARKVALVNSLWQRMAPRLAALACQADLVVLREPASQRALGHPPAALMPDLSYYDRPVWSRLEPTGFVKGSFYGPAFRGLELDATIDVERDDWSVMVNRLRHARALLTGKHHEVMAACVARCPFVTPAIATHKIAGLGDYAGVTLPQVAPGCGRRAVLEALDRAAADPDRVFARLFDTLEAVRDAVRLRDLVGRIV